MRRLDDGSTIGRKSETEMGIEFSGGLGLRTCTELSKWSSSTSPSVSSNVYVAGEKSQLLMGTRPMV
eukprot:scaffold5009_cov103-Isochrysis_galbana.AAC.4